MTDKLTSIAYDSDKHFAKELQIIIQMFDNLHASGYPLTANEILMQIPRDKYERLCRLSLEALQNRYKQSVPCGTCGKPMEDRGAANQWCKECVDNRNKTSVSQNAPSPPEKLATNLSNTNYRPKQN